MSASARDTSGLRGRSVAGVFVLIVVASLGQGVSYFSIRAVEASTDGFTRIARLSTASARADVVARELQAQPTRSREPLLASVRELESEEHALAQDDVPPFEDAGWARVALALAAVTSEARTLSAGDVVAPRAAQRLAERSETLSSELRAVQSRLEAETSRRQRWLSWLSWGSWGLLLASIVGVSRWVLRAGVERMKHDEAELADAERAVLDAADSERVRLGQELHDGLCQQLGGLRLLALATQRAASDTTTVKSLESLESLAARALDMARSLSHGLYPGDVCADNLAGALDRLGQEVSELGAFEFEFEGPTELPSAISDADAMQIYRVAQEALSNAVRHGHPGRVRISLDFEPLTLAVEDDGVGLSSASEGTTTAGVGLSSMHARARALDARIQFFSTPDAGTRVVVTRSDGPIAYEGTLDEISVKTITTRIHA